MNIKGTVSFGKFVNFTPSKAGEEFLGELVRDRLA